MAKTSSTVRRWDGLSNRMLCIGPGPGPKNVLVEFSDGTKCVFPYAIWKHKLSKEKRMAEGTYGSVAGIVQEFPDKDIINEREVSGQTIREFTIRSITSGQLARVTVWPETDEFTLQRGQLVGVDGLITVNEVKGTTYRNISANTLSLSPVVGRQERTQAVNKSTKKNEAIEQSEAVAF